MLLVIYLCCLVCVPFAWKENENDYLDNPIYEHFSLEPKYWEAATVYMNLSLEGEEAELLTPKYKEEDDGWLLQALQDVAFIVRGHKFGDFDRRIYKANIRNSSVKVFYRQFPTPPLMHLHQKVRHVCGESFIDCVSYLQKVAHHTQFVRQDFPGTATFNELKNTTLNNTELLAADKDCKLRLRSDTYNAEPFQGPLDRFHWKTTASYYMCYFTMARMVELKRLHEPCDNYASCLDPEFGVHNKDPRANDSLEFSCAMYSFCPDPCCPKHITSYEECWNDKVNPCYDIALPHARECKVKPEENSDFNQLVQNHWNITCNCPVKGYVFKSLFGMCVGVVFLVFDDICTVNGPNYALHNEDNASSNCYDHDIDECFLGMHTCDNVSQTCFNIPGGFVCGCRWGFLYDNVTQRCLQHLFLKPIRMECMPATEESILYRIVNFLHPGMFRRHQEAKEHKSKLIYNNP